MEDLTYLYPDCFTGLDKFQGKPYHIEVYPSIPLIKTLYKQVPIHQQAEFK